MESNGGNGLQGSILVWNEMFFFELVIVFLLPAEGDVALDMHFSPVFKAARRSPPALTFPLTSA